MEALARGVTVPITIGVDPGILLLPANLRALLRAHVGDTLDLTLRARRSKRSLAQNRSHWGLLVAPLAEHLGYDKHEIDDLHEGLLMRFAGTHADRATGAIVPNKRSSSMTVDEFSEFMQWTVRFAAQEFNVILSLPGEL